MACHKTQFPDENAKRISPLLGNVRDEEIRLAEFFSTAARSDLFR